MKLFAITLSVLSAVSSLLPFVNVAKAGYVRPYCRKDGVCVRGHYRSNPGSTGGSYSPSTIPTEPVEQPMSKEFIRVENYVKALGFPHIGSEEYVKLDSITRQRITFSLILAERFCGTLKTKTDIDKQLYIMHFNDYYLPIFKGDNVAQGRQTDVIDMFKIYEHPLALAIELSKLSDKSLTSDFSTKYLKITNETYCNK